MAILCPTPLLMPRNPEFMKVISATIKNANKQFKDLSTSNYTIATAYRCLDCACLTSRSITNHSAFLWLGHGVTLRYAFCKNLLWIRSTSAVRFVVITLFTYISSECEMMGLCSSDLEIDERNAQVRSKIIACYLVDDKIRPDQIDHLIIWFSDFPSI